MPHPKLARGMWGLHLRAARSNISTASTEVSSRSTEAPWQAENTSGNMMKAEACTHSTLSKQPPQGEVQEHLLAHTGESTSCLYR